MLVRYTRAKKRREREQRKELGNESKDSDAQDKLKQLYDALLTPELKLQQQQQHQQQHQQQQHQQKEELQQANEGDVSMRLTTIDEDERGADAQETSPAWRNMLRNGRNFFQDDEPAEAVIERILGSHDDAIHPERTGAGETLPEVYH